MLGDEDQDHRDDEREQTENLGGREADEETALLAVRGVGPETADVIALYGFDRPAFIADAYAWRLLTALGHDVPRPYERLRRHLEPHVRAARLSVHELQELHALVDEVGRLVARDPGLLETLAADLQTVAADDREVDRAPRATRDHSGPSGLERPA